MATAYPNLTIQIGKRKPELLPCPFCGGEANVVTNGKGFFNVSCPNEECCGYPTFLKYSTKAIAIKRWNTRTPKERGGEK